MQHRRALIVDDELHILTGLSKALRELCGFLGDIRTVVNGREAIHEVCHCFFDLCFLDIKLADINGISVMKEINYYSPETNIILMSASHMHDDLKEVVERGDAFFIEKPFNFSQIKQYIKLALEGRPESGRLEGAKRKKKRMFKRRTMSKIIRFNIRDSGFLEIKGGIIDISYAGMGIETYFPLEKGQILSLKGVANRTGVVVWSDRKGEGDCRAGIRFL